MSTVRIGVTRGLIELRQAFTNAPDLIGQFLTSAITLGVLFLLRNKTYGDSGLSVAELALPGLLGAIIAFNGMYALLNVLVLDREDGTLLRAKAIPKGMTGYFTGKIVSSTGSVIAQVVIVLGVGMVIIGGSSLSGLGAAATFAWVVLLGLLAVLPFGAILGSVLDTRTAFLLTMPLMGLIAISGIFYPITALPGWLQAVGQLFPMYWLGLGMRSALLPGDAAAIEIDQSWRHLETAAVLGVWAVAGSLLAPIVLRRMAGRESGAAMAARRDKAMQRAF
ncbi:ABC transporter permease [Nocardia asteroides NBRC 15531]|uniref:ABC transporter permease protein n=1 Tax=Nocardia asteroides NBRC 15531 TaxID=1110697 RepID=U5EGC4_NOCAS|nr:ABC transporter permease [Nocardia asteroides]TLF69236.1 ABC transporter permease [Nocardia asteroides NBRC 15531]UGT48725.1 ABC transporter permease [Nocardia asteroides]SFL69082.1 ABC-2 type transport system permease protein [Nocardia asteroides]VEG31619.1 daunorubicin resistance ABC transporter membrane protein [Nocardia asteroides]GAD85453.1 putative ABC transporter permease protein [Nocardia asteroides NBRC 15531]